MSFTLQFSLLLSFLTIYLITINGRSIITDPFNDSDQKLLITLANYRHRFDRSMNIKKLRWAFNSLNSTALCDACDLLVPEVKLSFSSFFLVKMNLLFIDASTDKNQSN